MAKTMTKRGDAGCSTARSQTTLLPLPPAVPLQLTQGLGDLIGKLLPVWEPDRPQATMAAVAVARMALVPAIILGLYYGAGPGFFFPMVFALLVSAW
jgi:hypothetical protein